MGSTESTLQPMEDSHNRNSSRGDDANRRAASRDAGDDPWWWEIEREDLVLDYATSATAASLSMGEETAESGEAAALSDDFNSLLKIGQHASETLTNTNSTIVTFTEKPVSDSTAENSNEAADVVAREQLDCDSDVADDADSSHSLDEFKEELRRKRAARQAALQDLRDEIATLRKRLAAEQMLTRRLQQSQNAAAAAAGDEATAEASSLECEKHEAKGDNEVVSKLAVGEGEETPDEVDDDDANACSRSRHANIELANAQLALQLATAENLSLRTELGVTQKQVATLKEVVACCKQMLAMKEEQCSQLKTKLNEIEESFGEREMKVMSENLRQEYERQLGNIRQLRQLYEERQRIAAAEQENLQRLIAIKKDELGAEQERTKNFEERNQALMKEVETVNKELAALREEFNEQKFEKKAFKEEMEAVNTLFSQMVMGFNGKNNLDIDRLATMLEENRALLNDMATREASCSDGATLPKLLFELVEQAAVGSRSATPESLSDCTNERQSEELASREENGEDEAVAVPVEAAQGEESTATASKIEVERLNDALDQTMQSVEQDEHGAEEEAKETETNEPDAISSSGNDNTNSSNHNNNSNKKSHNHQHQHHRKSAANKTRIPHASVSAAPNLLRFHEPQIFGQVASTQEIIGNLPKVWKVLMELLSHHKIEQVQFEENGAGEDCYKSVQTPNGPKAELSVSKTYIKLKDLILEKKSLVKETNRLKTLNCHLDYRLNEQEKRLSAVSLELTKTWHLVGKMQRQHRQLHTQEQILRYQLQQKRRLLSELKDELEYCRRKWAAARAKNDESQEQCNDLRREFAKRKLEDANNSAESGYSDSGPPSDEEGGRSALPAEDAACCRSKLRQMFEHSRKIKRMQSTSPGRANCVAHAAEVVLRWNSAPPTCGWRADSDDNDYDDDDDDEGDGDEYDAEMKGNAAVANQGAIHKDCARFSRSKQRGSAELADDASEEVAEAAGTSALPSVSSATSDDHVVRIERLEEQCKSLIQQVLETSDSRERLEVQLCRLQDAIAPVQHALPLEEFISKKRLERMTRASSAPASAAGTLTPREEEYTRKRSERLGRLEEESRQLISRIKRTSDRGHYLRCSLERLHKSRNVGGDCSSAALSRESSFDSNTEEDGAVALPHTEAAPKDLCYTGSPLTEAEEAYTTRRDERLKRLEAESKQLLTKLGENAHRGTVLAGQLDALHQQHGDEDAEEAAATTEQRIENIERSASSRSERLRVLEEEGKQLISRLSSTSERGTRMINRIAEREQSRAARIETAAKEAATRGALPTSSEPSKTTASADDPLLPPLKNVACSSIVSEELAECVTVTTTASQIAHNVELQGAVPKSKPLAQLSVVASRSSKSHTKPKSPTTSSAPAADTESLEQMVKRLQSIPFPEAESAQKEGAVEQAAATQEPPKEKPSTQQQQQQEQEKHT